MKKNSIALVLFFIALSELSFGVDDMAALKNKGGSSYRGKHPSLVCNAMVVEQTYDANGFKKESKEVVNEYSDDLAEYGGYAASLYDRTVGIDENKWLRTALPGSCEANGIPHEYGGEPHTLIWSVNTFVNKSGHQTTTLEPVKNSKLFGEYYHTYFHRMKSTVGKYLKQNGDQQLQSRRICGHHCVFGPLVD